jgi:hypothetical protein
MPFTFEEWYREHKTSRSNFYNMRRAGRGPRVTYISPGCGIITEADNEAFIRARQAEDEKKTGGKDGTP